MKTLLQPSRVAEVYRQSCASCYGSGEVECRTHDEKILVDLRKLVMMQGTVGSLPRSTRVGATYRTQG